MTKLEFPALRSRVKRWLGRFESCLRDHPYVDEEWWTQTAAARQSLDSHGRLRVVLTGEWNSGKSTLVRALTDADVKIDADVATTEVGEYDWEGVTIVDTPGIHSDRESIDHDEIARTATVGADLVLWVITNELFSPRLQAHFVFLASPDGLGLAGKMAVVVNKMDREANPDEAITAEIDLAVEPYSNLPVLLCAAKKYVDARDRDWPEDVRVRLATSSRFDAFIPALDEFIRNRGATGRLASPIQASIGILESAKERLSEGDESAANRIELLRRKRRVLHLAADEKDDIVASTASKIRSAVLRSSDTVTKQVSADATQEQIVAWTCEAMEAVYPQIEEILGKAQGDLRGILRQAESRLQEIDDSPLGIRVRDAVAEHEHASLEGVEGRPRKVARTLKAAKSGIGDGLKTTLEAMAKDPKALHQGVLKAGHKLGKKFRPWEAVKLGEKAGKVLGRAAKALPFLAAVLDFYIAYREEKEEDARHEHMAKLRLSVMRGFRDQAEMEVRAAKNACDKMVGDALAAAIKEVDAETTAVVAGRASDQYLADLDVVLDAGRQLRAEILG